MRLPRSLLLASLLALLLSLITPPCVRAEDGADDDDDDDAMNDDAGNGDDDDDDDDDDDNQGNNGNNENLFYWTGYAMTAMRCINYNDVDVIMFAVHEKGYKQCSDNPTGVYVTPVQYWVNAYLNQMEANQQDLGYDDYEYPDDAQYLQCTQKKIDGVAYYAKLGCTEGNHKSLSINIYSDNTCETLYKDEDSGVEDMSIALADLEVPFQKCHACVAWMDKDEDEVDDQYYINKQVNAPLCSQVWKYKQDCDRRCQRIGKEKKIREPWDTSDKILLVILSLFGFAMLLGIIFKRRKMSKKDTLLEQAAMSAAGLQISHVVGIVLLVTLIIGIFAILHFKNVTWTLLLITNLILFAYLMKLTVDVGNEPILGADGNVINRDDSDDDETDTKETPTATISQPESMLPAIT